VPQLLRRFPSEMDIAAIRMDNGWWARLDDLRPDTRIALEVVCRFNRQVSRGEFGDRGSVPHAHRARNASQNYDKKDIERADLALCAGPSELFPLVLGICGAVVISNS
jgi:hypothetical protein